MKTIRNILLAALFLVAAFAQRSEAIQPEEGSGCYYSAVDCSYLGGTWFSNVACNPSSLGWIWEVCDFPSGDDYAGPCCNLPNGCQAPGGGYFGSYAGCVCGC